MSLVDQFKKLPMESYGAAKKGAKKAVKKAAKPARDAYKKAKSDVKSADRAIFGGQGLRKNLKTLRAEIKKGQKK